MKRKAYLALLLAGAMMAGCSSQPAADSGTGNTADTQSTETSDTSDTSNTDAENSAPAALSALVEAAGDDTAALDAWKTIFENFADATGYQFEVETDGEDYLYDENASQTMVKDNFIYDIGKDSVFWKTGDDGAIALDLSDVEDSYQTLELGYGTIDEVGSTSVLTSVQTTQTDDDKLVGTVESVSKDATTLENEALNLLMDSAIDFGYIRNVNPISNSSLYSYDLTQDGSKWVLKLSIKDVDAFKKEAATAAFLINDRTNRPTLVIDNIESETFTFTFNDQGILESEENDIFHVINGISDEYSQKYMNLLNKAEFKQAKSDEIKPDSFTDYFAQCADGTLAEGDSFTITDWN